MNTYKTNYKTVVSITEEGKNSFRIDKDDAKGRHKAIVLERLGIYPDTLDCNILDVALPKREIKASSYSSEYELMMDMYWTVAKALITEESGNNIIKSFRVDIGKTLTNDSFKVILINIDFLE